MRNLFSYTVLLVASLATGMVVAETDYRDWQLQKLLDPTERDLARENGNRVFIYDGLKDSDIEHAMKTQFDRVAGMMFVRTLVTDDLGDPLRDELTGEPVTEDDDCD